MARNKTDRRQIDTPQKNRFIGCVLAGESKRKAADKENIPQTTGLRIFNQYNSTGTTHYNPRPGRPSMLNGSDKRYLVREMKKNRRIPFKQLGSQNIPVVSASTVRRVAQKANLRRCVAKPVPL